MKEPGDLNHRAARKSIFAEARLATASGTGTVRIRNVSETGALVEGDGLPLAGVDFRLSQGEQSVLGTVQWSRGNRAGLSFAYPTEVAQWMPRRIAASDRRGEVPRSTAETDYPSTPSNLSRDRTLVKSLTSIAELLDAALEADISPDCLRPGGGPCRQKVQASIDLVHQLIRSLT